MTNRRTSKAKIIHFPLPNKRSAKPRKFNLNKNKEGSVRNVNGKVYVDFRYLGERVRESSDLVWNQKNARHVRKQLDKIIVDIDSETFRFAMVFPKSKHVKYFTEKEQVHYGLDSAPDQILFEDYAWEWYKVLKGSGRITKRTLGSYRGYMNKYLIPFFGKKTFGSLNKTVCDEFIRWAKEQKYRGKVVSNESIKRYFVPLKMICKDAAIKYGWGGSYDPFFGLKLPANPIDAYEKIFPFSIEEQKLIITELPDHWKPYFKFAFASGLSQGEQVALKVFDIDWRKGQVCIQRAMTRDENDKPVEGWCKNKYRRRTIKLSPKMLSALTEQKKIYDQFKGEYFFCSETGKMFDASNVRTRVWIPALKGAGVKIRDMKQTRHSFATYHLSCGKNPLQIAKVMGHRNAEMVVKVYSKCIEDSVGLDD